jgi:hypothetical protein
VTKEQALEKIEMLVKQARSAIDEADQVANEHGVSFVFADETFGAVYSERQYTERRGWFWADSGCSSSWDASGC